MKYRIKDDSDLKKKAENMSVRELLASVICPDFPLNATPVRNTTSVMLHAGDINAAKAVSEKLNSGREEKALVVADLEYGAGKAAVGAVEFPSMRAAAEAGDEQLAYNMGRYSAGEAALAGYSWTFGPCVDIIGDKSNPIVSIRTAGENADDVIRYGGAYMRGLQDGGLIATLKHFPGDGCCNMDQHVTTTCNPLGRVEWDKSFGRVYGSLIEQGVKAIMPGHISLPAYDALDEETGLYPPATVSKNLLTGLLRKKLGFEGIIVSDAIAMGGFCGYMNLYRASARFLEAGGDCILFMHPTEEYFSEMQGLIDAGALHIEVLKNRAYRMLCFSREYFESEKRQGHFDRRAAEDCCEAMVMKSVKAVRDRKGLLPLDIRAVKRVAHIILGNPGITDSAFGAAKELTQQLKEKGITAEEYTDPGCRAIKEMAKSGEYDLIICSVVNEMTYGLNCLRLSGPVARNMMEGWMRYPTPTVFISYFDPYFKDDFCASTDTVINTYGYSPYTNKYVIKALFGTDK